MTEFVITCPNPACGRPLRLPADVVGKPLACPHCRTAIAVTLAADGTPTATNVPTARRVPGLFLVPGFALFMLGVAGAFVNGYVALESANNSEKALEHGRRMVADLRSLESLTGASKESKGKGDVTPQEVFAAVAGQAARIAQQEQADEAVAAAWAPRVPGFHALFLGISVLSALGGLAIITGRWYWLALLGCVAAAANLNAGCCVPGGIAGLWGFLMLVRDDGRKHFGL
jgi:hypothetical protein